MQVNATLQRKVTALAVLLSILWCTGWPLSSAKAQKVYANDQTSGRTGICAFCGPAVTDPENAANANHADYATFNLNGVAIGVSVFEVLKFPSVNPNPGCDSLVIQIGSSQALLSANLLSNITITTSNGGNSNNDAVTVTPALLRLLDDSSTALIVLRPTAAFDRVEIRESALIAALSSLRLYYAYYAPVNLNNITIANGSSATVCAGTPITLSAAVPAGGATIQWFNTATGGTPLAATSSYTFTPAANTTLYAGAVLGNCASTTRQAITVNVNPAPATPVVGAATAIVCSGQTAAFSITNPQPGVTYNWYNAATGGAVVGTGSTFITPALSATATYYAEASLATGCTSPARAQVTATVNATPAVPVVTPAVQAIAGGSTATLNISNPVTGATYNWYTAPTGGTPVGTGTSFTTPVLFTNAVYYAEVTSAQGCVNSSRALATVTVSINNNVPCSFATTQQSPVYTGGLNICALCSVSNPNNAIDTDTTTASSLTTPVSLGGGYMGQRLTYPHSYLPGDSVRLLLGLPGGLVDLQLLGGVRVETYNNGVANGDAVLLNNPLLLLNLLGGERFNATVAATKPFNAVLVSIGGVGTLLTTLNIYGASVIIPRPVVNPASGSICTGGTATFNVTTPTSGADIAWYAAPVGGTALGTGPTFTTPVLNTTTTYYVEAGRFGCANPVRTPVTVQVTAQPAAPVPATANDSVCAGQSATLAVTPVTGVTFSWYASETDNTPLATGTNFTTPALTATTTYYVSAGNGGCSSATRTAITAVVAAAPTGVTVTPAGAAIQAGQSVTLTASAASGAANFNWFTTATGGTSIASGATFTSPLLFSNTIYYVEASNPTTGCVAPQRVAVSVTVNNPDIPDISCGAAGSQSASTNGLCVGCYVENPDLAVDNSPITGSTLHVVLGLLGGYVQQSFLFGSVSNGDSVHIGLSFPTGLADVGLLSGVQVQSYNGNTANNDLTTLSPALLTLRLASAQATANFLPAAPYDRIVVRLNSGVLGALSAVNVAYVQRFVNTPVPQEDSVYACGGQPAILHASAPANATFRWYTQPIGGTPVGTGADFTTPAVNANTVYYLEAVSADGCPSPARTAVKVFAGIPGAAVSPANVTLNSGEQATFSVINPDPAYTYTWYDAPSGGTLVHTGSSFTTPALTAGASYYVVVSNATGCSSTVRTQVTVNINIPVDPAPCSYANTQTSPVSTAVCLLCSITDPGLAVDGDRNTATRITSAVGLAGYYGQTLHFANVYPAGDSVQIELEVPGSIVDAQVLGGIRIETYQGATANGDGRILTDSLINLSLLSGNRKFRVTVPVSKSFDGVNISVGGLVSAVTSILVYDAAAVVPSPTVPAPAGICSGSTATLTATTPANADITWYTQAVGGTVAGTGNTFTTPALTTSTTYYVAAGRFGCNSPARTAVTVNVGNPAAAPTVAGVQVCAGTTATLTATAPANVTFQWFANATDTTVIFTGTSFTTAVLNADTTFYVASITNGCASGRTAVPVSVGQVPTAFSVTPSSVTVAYGSTVTFTATAQDTAAIFNYYTTASGGTPVFTGKVFRTPSLTTNTTYYAEAASKAGCTTNFRIPLTVTVLADTSGGLVPCDAVTAQTNTANGICVGCYVDNPGFAIDSSTATGATLHTVLGLLGGYVSQTLIFPSVSEVGDSVRIDLSIASGLADVGLLSSVQVGTYNGTTFNNDLQAVNSGLITLRLLSNTQAFFTFKPGQSFDRVEVRLNSGLAQALNAITIRDAYRKVAVPVVSGSDTASICAGQSASLAVAPVNNVTMRWYTQSIGGTPVFSGNNYVTPNLSSSTTFWVEAVRTSSDCATQPRVPVTVIVLPAPGIPQVTQDTVTICNGSKATFTATAQAGVFFRWYGTATGGTPLDSGTTFTTPALTQSTIYYLEAGNAGGCANATRKAVLANVISTPLPPAVTPAADTICAHNNVVLQASSATPGLVYNWYNTATGSTAIATGANFTTPLLDSTTTYYVESVAGNCSSSTRTAVKVTVNPAPAAPVITPASAAVNTGATVIFAADSSRPGIIYQWYTVATGGSPVYTGNRYTTLPLTANVTYYVEAVSASGCVSIRTPVNVTVNSVTPGCDLVNAQTVNVNGLCIGCSVTNPGNAIDADTTTYSTLNALLNLVNGYVSQTFTMPTSGTAGDTARFALEYPAQLVNASLIGGLQVQTFKGGIANGDLHNVDINTITLNLLSGSNKFYLDVVPTQSYDQVEIRLNSGLLSAAQTLRIYYGGLKPITPSVSLNNVTICAGSTADLHATARTAARIEWYSAPVGGTLLHTGGDYTTAALTSTTTYYVQTVRTATNCVNPNRVPVTVSVLPVPTVTITGGNRSICSGTPVSIAATVTPATATVRWYDAATGGNLVYTGNPLVTGNLTRDTTFYAEGDNGSCGSITRTAVSVTVGKAVTPPVLSSNNLSICSGQTATLQVSGDTAGLVFRWYTTAIGGTAIFTGPAYTTGALTANAVYYVEAANAGGACNTASARTVANVQVTPVPTVPVPVAIADTVCVGQPVTLAVSNPQAGLIYQWYTASSGGTLVFTGPVFNIASADTAATYYVQASSGTGCSSTSRAAVKVVVRTAPATPVLTVASQNICTGLKATFTINAPVTGIVYRWYDAASGGNLLATGNSFTTPVLTAAATYYVEAFNASCSSSTRAVASVTVGTPTTPTLVSNNLSVCAGQSVTFQIANPVNGLVYNWYTVATGGTPVYTGSSYTIDALTASTTLYVEASSANGDCAGTSGRVTATATLLPAPATPTLAAANAVTCGGSNVTFTVSNPQAGITYQWFDAATGGTLLATGTSYTVNNITQTTSYYVQGLNNSGCTSTVRAKATATVSATPSSPVLSTDTVYTCINGTATFTVNNPDNTLAYTWWDAASGGTQVGVGPSFTTPALIANKVYFAQAAVPNGGCTSTSRTPARAIVTSNLATPVVANPATVACSGQPVTVSVQNPLPGVLYRWYTTATGGTPVYTGNDYTITGITSGITYYVEAATTSGCVSPGRAAAAITVSAAPATPSLTDDQVSACSGQQVTLSVSNPQAGVQYKWYATATGGTALATGATFKTPVITATTNYYVEAQSTTGGCTSATRAIVTVTLLPAGATPTVTGDQVICPGSSATLTASSTVPGAIFSWYTSETATTPVYTGNSFTTPVLTASTTYYVGAAPGSFCGNAARVAADVNVEQQLAAPNVRVCDSTSENAVTFCWDPVQGAQAYVVSVNGGTFVTPSSGATGTSHTVTGLQSGQRVAFQVRALGQLACATSAIAAIEGRAALPKGNVIYVPNVFSPNGDGNNDKLYVYSEAIVTMEFIVYNKWGESIFTSKDVHAGWDGTASGSPQPVGVYVWVLKATMTDGSQQTRYGTVTIVR